jgi:hypothetical protein
MMTVNETPQERLEREARERDKRVRENKLLKNQIAHQRSVVDAEIDALEKREEEELRRQSILSTSLRTKQQEATVKRMAEGMERARLHPPEKKITRPAESPIGIYLLNIPKTRDAQEFNEFGGHGNVDKLLININGGLLEFTPGQELTVEENGQHIIDALFSEGYDLISVKSKEHLIQLRGSL